MLARKRFRLSLYKLMLLKNIIENKVHKEKMQMLYAFEQMIINTEDENDQEYYDEMYGAEEDKDGEDDDAYGDEQDGDYDLNERDISMAALSYYQKYKQFPPMQRIPVEAEYMSNPSDVIDEEEFEESQIDPNSPLKTATKVPNLKTTTGPQKVEPSNKVAVQETSKVTKPIVPYRDLKTTKQAPAPQPSSQTQRQGSAASLKKEGSLPTSS